MFKLALNPSGLFSHSNERKRTGKSESDFHKTDKVKYFITGSSDSDKIVRSFLPHKDQLKWRLFSREINENKGPASVMWNRIYLQNKERYFNVRSFFVSPCGTYLFLVAIHSSEKANALKILDFNTQVVLKEFIIESLYGRFDDVPSNSIVMVPCDKGMIISSSHVKENTIFTWVSEAHVGKSLINLNQIKISQGTLSKTEHSYSSGVVLSHRFLGKILSIGRSLITPVQFKDFQSSFFGL